MNYNFSDLDIETTTGSNTSQSWIIPHSRTQFTHHGGTSKNTVTEVKVYHKGKTYSIGEDLAKALDSNDPYSTDAIRRLVSINKIHTGLSKEELKDEIIKVFDLTSLATGGYTGSWGPEGKLAVLHEKEIVLNKQDTENLLLSIDMLNGILSMIDTYAKNQQLGGFLSSPGYVTTNSETVEQNVHIEANFPSVTDRNEIEEAFNNLINTAANMEGFGMARTISCEMGIKKEASCYGRKPLYTHGQFLQINSQ